MSIQKPTARTWALEGAAIVWVGCLLGVAVLGVFAWRLLKQMHDDSNQPG